METPKMPTTPASRRSSATAYDGDYSDGDDIALLADDYLLGSKYSVRRRQTDTSRSLLIQLNYRSILHRTARYGAILLQILLPSFLHKSASMQQPPSERSDPEVGISNQLGTEKDASRPANGSIQCLDGLRGWACLIVFNFHFLYPWTKSILYTYGTSSESDRVSNNWPHQLPGISLIYRGRAMVAIFFAISGYVLSRKVLMLIRSGDAESARSALTSSVFRRAIRLYIPPTVSMFLVMLAVRGGLFMHEIDIYHGKNAKYITGVWEQHPPVLGNWRLQLFHWRRILIEWSNPFSWQSYYGVYDPHTWTIPLEFRCSIVLFVTLLGTAGLKSHWRLATTIVMSIWSLIMLQWDVAIFLGGMAVCEIDLMLGTWERRETNGLSNAVGRAVFWWLTLIMSLYLLSFPDNGSKEGPLYTTLAWLTPTGYGWRNLFWHAVGSILLVWTVTNAATFRRCFEGSVSRYFGKISFAFYLVHGPVLHSIGFRFMLQVWKLVEFDSNVAFCTGLAIGWVVMFMLSVWLADVFWRLIDVPSTKVARRIELMLSI